MLINKTKRQGVIERVELADSFLKKFLGLMFRPKGSFNYALVFPFSREEKLRASIHMMFVFFSIDAVYLDREKKVVDLKKWLKPFTLNYTPKKKAKYLIELPAGKAARIEPGDKLEW